ncbi:MAG: aspartate aminotransferase family protein [Bacteroidia bacterium]|nr:aspartate aminotransferase family protein [Bacteroidia bacterium]
MKTFDVYPLFDIEPTKAEGSYIWDANGTKYLDLYGGHAVISIGHTHPHYVQALKQQLDEIAFYSNSVKIPLQDELATKLGAISKYPDYQLFLCNSGAEANENALKLASFHNGRKKVIAFSQSFHGRTSLAVSATDDAKIIAPINETDNIIFLPFNDEEALKTNLTDEICAVIVEGIQGVGGVNIANASFLKLMRKLCNKTGAIMILDEVQSGYGRSGHFFAHQHANVQADCITVAKGMGNGFPVGGVLISNKFTPKHGMLGTTFGGNYLACSAAIAVLDVIASEQLIANAANVGTYIIEAVKQMPNVKEVRGLGLMIGIELNEPCAPLRNKLLFDHHIFTGASSNKNTLRILPALNLNKQEADIFLTALASLLAS